MLEIEYEEMEYIDDMNCYVDDGTIFTTLLLPVYGTAGLEHSLQHVREAGASELWLPINMRSQMR
jgi:hypothetical protein